jgi:hypothetical protein
MANYLERIASSAGRRAAIAKPPLSGPPVLPAGRDFAVAPEAVFASDEDQFVETLETHAPARTEEHAVVPATAKFEARPKTTAPHNETLAAPVEPKPQPRPTHKHLSSESPFTVQVPRTLRPITTANVAKADEPPREQPHVIASTTVGPEQFTINEEPAPIVHSANTDVATESADMPARPKPPVADPTRAPRAAEATPPNTAPIPRMDAPPRYSTEPSPPPAMPVHLPPATGNATRQDQSRVHIGSLEVLVNNHPQITPVRPAPAPSRTESLNLEKRYLDRFRLRH